jgi:hypothetical protein
VWSALERQRAHVTDADRGHCPHLDRVETTTDRAQGLKNRPNLPKFTKIWWWLIFKKSTLFIPKSVPFGEKNQYCLSKIW